MNLDLSRALRAAVDTDPGHDPSGGEPSAPGGMDLGIVRARVRRRRAARAGSRAVVGAGAACAVGAGAVALGTGGFRAPSSGGTPPTVAAPAATTATPATPVRSWLCGQDVGTLAVDPGDVTVSVGLPDLADLGAFTGRSLGPSVPVWVTVPADAGAAAGGSTVRLGSTDLVLTRDGTVVGVVDGAASAVSAEPATDLVAALTASAQSTGTGALEACADGAATASDGTLAAGEYALHAVTRYSPAADGSQRRVVSAGVPLTLLPTAPDLTDAAALPDGFPLGVVPVISGEVVDSRTLTGGGWEVTLAVAGDDGLVRASEALGFPTSVATVVWGLADGAAALAAHEVEVDPLVTSARAAAISRALGLRAGSPMDDPGADALGVTEVSGSDSELRLKGTDLLVSVQTTQADGQDRLVYRVTPRP